MIDNAFLFKNKKILFIGPKYFNYETNIINELITFGATVRFIPENLDYFSIWLNFINKLPKFISNYFNNDFFLKRIKKVQNLDFDYVLVIRGRLISPHVMSYLRNKLKNIPFIMYQWDSINNVKKTIEEGVLSGIRRINL
jgi:hypothetical protein